MLIEQIRVEPISSHIRPVSLGMTEQLFELNKPKIISVITCFVDRNGECWKYIWLFSSTFFLYWEYNAASRGVSNLAFISVFVVSPISAMLYHRLPTRKICRFGRILERLF
uniref:Eukaryotic translation initiation factor 3 subunit C N-terminal domain-containing protein n=1 Tax=Parascaris univalens TaxID=6257 RepID=A0A915A1I8_PARUN